MQKLFLRRKLFATFILTLLESVSIYASHISHTAVFSFGEVEAHRLTNQTVSPIDENGQINTYFANVKSKTGPTVGVGFLKNYSGRHFTFSIGPVFNYAGLRNVNGVEYPESQNGLFNDTLDYNFNVSSIFLAVESRISYHLPYFTPFLIVDLGNTWNKLSNFNETPSEGSTAGANEFRFKDHNMSHFLYEIGVGISHEFFSNKHHHSSFLTGLEYRYTDYGNAKLGKPNSNWEDLRVSHLTSQSIMLECGFKFN